MRLDITVNGHPRTDDVEPRLLLAHYLRDVCGLRATNIGCDTTSCGACTVHVDGEAVKSCTVLAVSAAGSAVTTLEGLAASPSELHPVQRAFRAEHALQCGFCTPGMVMAAVALIDEHDELVRTRRPRGARGQPVPLHRLPQHRARRARRRARAAGSHRMIPAAFDYVRGRVRRRTPSHCWPSTATTRSCSPAGIRCCR